MKNQILKLSSKFTALPIGAAIAALLSVAASDLRAADYATTVSNLYPLVYYRLNDPAPSIQTADVASNLTSLAPADLYYLGTAGVSYTHPATNGLIGSMTGAASFAGGFAVAPYFASANQTTFAAEIWFNVNPSTTGVLLLQREFGRPLRLDSILWRGRH
jgi:hypothetical protein